MGALAALSKAVETDALSEASGVGIETLPGLVLAHIAKFRVSWPPLRLR